MENERERERERERETHRSEENSISASLSSCSSPPRVRMATECGVFASNAKPREAAVLTRASSSGEGDRYPYLQQGER